MEAESEAAESEPEEDEVEVEVKSLMDGTWQDMLRVARGLNITVDGVLERVARPEE